MSEHTNNDVNSSDDALALLDGINQRCSQSLAIVTLLIDCRDADAAIRDSAWVVQTLIAEVKERASELWRLTQAQSEVTTDAGGKKKAATRANAKAA